MLPYSTLFVPPAPALDIIVTNIQTGSSSTTLAKVDTAADSSIIPEDVVAILDLTPFNTLASMSFDNSLDIHISYLVDFTFAGRTFTHVEVIATSIPYVILGRDVLNQFVITLDGPQLVFDIQ